MQYKIGFYQFQPTLLEVGKNLKKIKQTLQTIQADLIILPELATSGYVFASRKEVESVSESAQDGKTADLFRNLAKKNNTSYVVGFAEKDGDYFYNSSMLINPDGKIYVYRKVHLFYEEKIWFEPGNLGFPVFRAKKDVKIGMMICFDWIFPESARSLTINGAEIIAHSANLVLPWCQQAMITRSLENRVFSITANRIGTEQNGEKKQTFTGMSQLVTPQGKVIHRANETEETVFLTTVNPEEARNKNVTGRNHILTDRRSHQYSLQNLFSEEQKEK